MEETLFPKEGKLPHTVEAYVNHVNLYPSELVRLVEEGGNIYLFTMLAGG
jgi:intracellular sulfur oxidation DsrE/DsrF family protein